MARPRSWTDDDLREQLPLARSWRDLRDRLGLVGGGSTTERLRRRCVELDLDARHLPEPGAMPRRWTDEQLIEAVAAATSLKGVLDHLGLSVGGSAWRRMQDHVVRLGLDTSHWIEHGVHPGTRAAKRPRPIDDDELRRVLPGARSLAQVLLALGLEPNNGASYRRVKRRIMVLGLSTDHLDGQAWAKGTTGTRTPRPLEDLLVHDPTYAGCSAYLRDRLVDEGVLEWRCSGCGITEWNGQKAPLQLDHVNGDPTDNRRENLRLLCPNCHAQTPTYCGRNIGKRYSSGSGSG